MKTTKKIDMTTGSITKNTLFFAIPICIGNILQLLYTTVDTLVIGNYCGKESLAAVGTSAQPVEILLCIFMGLGTGVSILVSQYTGSNDIVQQKKTIHTATLFCYLCAIPLTIIGILLGPFMLKMMQVPADTWDYAVSYLNIIFLGILGNMGYNLNAGILRGVGDSKSSLKFLFISCVLNIVLDILFVGYMGMDVTGAALATTIAVFTSWFASIIYIKKHYPEIDFRIFPRKIDKLILKDIISVGLPLGLNNALYAFGHVVMQSLINMQGSAFMAACSVGGKVNSIANVAITSLSSAATTFSGQNLGAKNYVRLKKGALRIPLMSGLITITFGLTVTYFCEYFIQLFTKDPEVIVLGIKYVETVLPFTWAYAILNGIIYFANGLGEIKYPTIINILMLWAVRIPSAYFIAYFIDGQMVMASVPISFIFGMIAMLFFFKTKKWKEILVLANAQ